MTVRVSQALGRWGEDLVVRRLEAEGLRVLARNWRAGPGGPPGELDVVALDHGTLVICEVKTRSSVRFGTPGEAVTERKQRIVRRLAAAYVASRGRGGVCGGPVRIDVLTVLRGADGVHVEHLRGVA
jgi:putative endonuclease